MTTKQNNGGANTGLYSCNRLTKMITCQRGSPEVIMDIEGSPQQSSALLIYQVDPYEIHYLKFILEAYDGLATLTTLDPEKGIIQLAVPPGSKGTLEDLLEALGQELGPKGINRLR